MNTRVLRVAVFGAVVGLMSSGSAVFAGAADKCLQPLVHFQDGMPAVESASDQTADQKIDETTSMFRAVMAGAQASQMCYADQMSGMTDPAALAKLKQGAEEAARIFRLAQKQFEMSLDELSASALSDVAPAAGADTMMGADDGMVDSMEQLFDSYMVLERSQELGNLLANFNSQP